jgi:hypothetical protein
LADPTIAASNSSWPAVGILRRELVAVDAMRLLLPAQTPLFGGVNEIVVLGSYE